MSPCSVHDSTLAYVDTVTSYDCKKVMILALAVNVINLLMKFILLRNELECFSLEYTLYLV
jgi:hypothetical protein